ncbi:hypothetical protein [Laribacter hongkongensis]|uniref:hypothetical protein n=1 Tax=Laribacter hongkongensis TaxID=168471 RepID=UPI001EFCC625|nr:hypothetical protein [Laribacter hongkongensis]MCG9033345.1 hypothetical protein [Laribacter hongkongensis]MCG9093421.1 hypothetical protein [Laribacter hongkongensis]
MNKLISFSLLLILTGCATDYTKNEERNKALLKAVQEGRSYYPESILTAYKIRHGLQHDDSIFIGSNNLNHVAKMAKCQPATISENPHEYLATAVIDRDDMTVKIKINREGCQVDNQAVQAYFDDVINKNRIKAARNFEREKQARERDPRGPYKLGCEAYKRHIKGLGDVVAINTAIKLYPKINSDYVKRLFIAGWQDASVYGVRGVDCMYLSLSIHD